MCSLIAAGSEGEIHLAELVGTHKSEAKSVCVKVPHLDGLDALDGVLEVHTCRDLS